MNTQFYITVCAMMRKYTNMDTSKKCRRMPIQPAPITPIVGEL